MKCGELIQLLEGRIKDQAHAAYIALEERRRIRKLNTATLAENQTRREFNRLIWVDLSARFVLTASKEYHYKRLAKPMIKLKHTVDKKTRKTLKDLEVFRKANAGEGCQGFKPHKQYAGAKTPEKWSEQIRRIVDPVVRASVACIIWWDFFSQRVRAAGQSEWAHLSDLMDTFRDHPPALEICHALIDCGYHPFDAAIRVTGGECHR